MESILLTVSLGLLEKEDFLNIDYSLNFLRCASVHFSTKCSNLLVNSIIARAVVQ